MSSAEGVRLPSAAAAATAPQPAPTEEARLLGDARGRAGAVASRKSPWRYLRRFAEGEYVSYRVLTAIAFMGMGAVALVLNVTVERVAQAPVSMNWIQSLAGQADPHLAAHLAAARTEIAPLSEVAHPRRLGGRLHAELEEEEQKIAMRRQLERRDLERRTRPAAALGGPFETPEETSSPEEEAASDGTASDGTAPVGTAEKTGDAGEKAREGQRRPEKAAGGTFPAVALAATSRVRADDARCDLRPHRGPSHGDVFKCDAAMFDEARRAARFGGKNASAFSPARSKAGTPAWPQQTSLTRNTARTPSALRADINACRRDARVDFEGGEKDRPYVLPADGVSTAEKSGVDSDAFTSVAGSGSAYVYAFLHVHKCGGTFIDNTLRLAAEKIHARVQAQTDAGVVAPQRHAGLFPNFPLMELTTTETRRFMAWTFANARPSRGTTSNSDVSRTSPAPKTLGDYGAVNLRARYDAGERLFVKSSEAMGFCDYVDAPCAYLTVLREPLERFLSYYAYICLLGAEQAYVRVVAQEALQRLAQHGEVRARRVDVVAEAHRLAGLDEEMLAGVVAPSERRGAVIAERDGRRRRRGFILRDLRRGHRRVKRIALARPARPVARPVRALRPGVGEGPRHEPPRLGRRELHQREVREQGRVALRR